jgi:short-subunit dehydrogenase
MADHPSFSVITGASSGIGFELARVAARHGSDLVIVADSDKIHQAAQTLRSTGRKIEVVQADLATRDGVDHLYERVKAMGRPVDALFANAGRGQGHAFLDQSFEDIERVINTNVVGTVYMLHRFLRDMRQRGQGKVLVTGSIAGFMPGTYQAVYNATKAFIDSFSYALRHEVAEQGISVTCLMPGPTDTDFFEEADMLDTKVGTDKKDDPAKVAEDGYNAMIKGEGHEIVGVGNKLQVMMSRIAPQGRTAEMHRKLAEPGTGKPQQH